MSGNHFDDVKLVVTDLDGTLLSSDKTIARRNLEAAFRLRSAGIELTLSSGRPFQMIETYARQLAVKIPVICSNGAMLYQYGEGPVDAVAMERAAALEMLDAAMRIGADYMAYTKDRVWFTEDSRRIGRFQEYNRIAKATGDSEMEFSFFGGSHAKAVAEGVLKILVVERSGDDEARMREAARKVPGILLEIPESGALEVNDVKAGKGNGVRRICAHLGVDPAQVCVFGDWYNDLSMFRAAGYSVAMDNALFELKRAATIVTGTNDGDGFAQAVEQYIL